MFYRDLPVVKRLITDYRYKSCSCTERKVIDERRLLLFFYQIQTLPFLLLKVTKRKDQRHSLLLSMKTKIAPQRTFTELPQEEKLTEKIK